MADTPAKKPAKRTARALPAPKQKPKAEPLPEHKDDLVAFAIRRGIPSYEAWAMTVPELTDKLKG